MDSLRLVLIFIGIVVIVAIYTYEKARRKGSDTRYSRWGGSEEQDFIPRNYEHGRAAMPADTADFGDVPDDLEEDYDEDDTPSDQDTLKDITDELQQLEGIIATRDNDIEQLEIDGLAADKDQADGADNEPDEVIVINIFSTDGRVLSGPDILDVAMKENLQFGEMGFFHRQDESGNTLFSMANALQPGSFDIAAMETLATRGLVFFMALPGTGDPLANFDSMMTTIRNIASSLHAQLHDETRSVLTRQGIDEIRDRISEYKLKAMGNTESA
jgi:cell division protein ZipA